MRRVTLVKLGGGLIAPKEWEYETVDRPVLERLACELAEIQKVGKKMIVVSGSGNFGHHAVKKYGIADERGVARVRASAKKIGQEVTTILNNVGIKGKLYISHQVIKDDSLNLESDLSDDAVPVFYGDVMGNKNEGWQIYSGEMIIGRLIEILQVKGWKIDVVQVSLMEGVLDSSGQVISEINMQNWPGMVKQVTGASGIDVTGGMLHKVEQSLEFARKFGVETLIVGGTVPGRLELVLRGSKTTGTVIRT